jgi:hypothetical protein
MGIQDNFIQAASCSALSFLLYKTEFIAEYGKIFKIIPFKQFVAYKCFKIQNNKKTNFFDFLNFNNNNFLTRLLSCPYCLGFWTCLIFSKIQFVFFVYFMYIVLYKMLDLIFDYGTTTGN